MIISKGFERLLRLTPLKATTMTWFDFEYAVDQPGDQALVLVPPERGKREALEFAAIDAAEPCSRQAEHGFAACVPFEDEGVGEQCLDIGRLNLGAFGGRAAIAKAVPIVEQRD